MDSDRWGDEVERESFLPSVGEGDFDFTAGGMVLMGEEELASSSDPSEPSDFSALVPGSLEADLDLETSCSTGGMASSTWSLSVVGVCDCDCKLSKELSTFGLVETSVVTGFQAPAI